MHWARAGRIEVRVADRPDEVDQALTLRFRVFATELGADLRDPQGRDRDVFDAYCRHLIAWDLDTGRVVGTYRALLPEDARRLGFLYADRELVLLGLIRCAAIWSSLDAPALTRRTATASC